MISVVADIINTAAFLIHRVLYAASVTGQVIVFITTGFFSSVFQICKSLFLFIQIICEDNSSVFTEDLPNIFDSALTSITIHFSSIQDILVFVFDSILHKFNSLFNTLNWAFIAVFLIICEVLTVLKNAFIFVGDTLWIVLTFIPFQLPLLLKIVFSNALNIIVEFVINSYKALLRLTNFLTDVPLQSLAGILATIIVVRLSVYFRADLERQIAVFYWALRRKFWYLYHMLYNYFFNSEVRMISQMAASEEMVERVGNFNAEIVDDPDDPADTLCIICQERQKCVLTLPCRHICLCIECCMRLYGYQRTCPICRTFIYHSVTVYL